VHFPKSHGEKWWVDSSLDDKFSLVFTWFFTENLHDYLFIQQSNFITAADGFSVHPEVVNIS